jgi:hypothetical protein
MDNVAHESSKAKGCLEHLLALAGLKILALVAVGPHLRSSPGDRCAPETPM